MSDKMHPIKFEKLITWITIELKEHGTIFGIHKNKFYKNKSGKKAIIFGEELATPLGPAAGPNTQLTQNIVSAYLTGSRFIELKTVQIIDGEDLPVSKPCIESTDEGYNVEWSTELRVTEAYDEYIKAWFILHVLMKELNLSEDRDFMFNMSVGYDLEGIKSPKIDAFIEGMRNSGTTKVWEECRTFLISHMDMFSNFTLTDLEKISPVICPSITLSTLHGCPPQEIERISNYLLKEKGLHTFIKMNPTLLGERFVRDTFDKMGYDYIKLNGHHFTADLKYADGLAMLKRLKAVAADLNLAIGVKLTNTLPVKVLNDELSGEEMYLSGRALFPLTITLASRLVEDFNGDLLISYSGGTDYFNVDKILATGIQPITFATTLLKPGGYERITQMAYKVEEMLEGAAIGIKTDVLKRLADASLKDKHHLKELRPVKSRKLDSPLPLYDCAISPCSTGCPINQQIPQYLAKISEKKYDEAFSIIVKDNSSPFITGTICDHNCQYKCTRLDYDESELIRDMKKLAAINAQDKYIENILPQEIKSDKKVAVIGAGAAGLSVALFLRRNGMDVTVMDKRDKAYGLIEYVIPEFRISSDIISKDLELVKRNGVKFKFGVNENFNIETLKLDYDYIILAIGAGIFGQVTLKAGNELVINAITFLENLKANKGDVKLGKHVCIIGGGNVAIDAARAAKRVSGVESVSIVYRRTKEFMPAIKEEVNLALTEGIILKELLSPVAIKDGKLHCEEMELGKRDAQGRKTPVETGKTVLLEADTVIVAVGEKIDSEILIKNGIEVDSNKFPKVNAKCETNITNVYVAGDMKKGPATIVKAIADGKIVSKDILLKTGLRADFEKLPISLDESNIYDKKGILCDPLSSEKETKRCLSCESICELCVDVCPNRANVLIKVEGGNHQIIHVDEMCNECGNCGVFCPHTGNPYKDKVTIFWNETDFLDSTNIGFMVVDKEKGLCKVRKETGDIVPYSLGQVDIISEEMAGMIKSCINNYSYIL